MLLIPLPSLTEVSLGKSQHTFFIELNVDYKVLVLLTILIMQKIFALKVSLETRLNFFLLLFVFLVRKYFDDFICQIVDCKGYDVVLLLQLLVLLIKYTVLLFIDARSHHALPVNQLIMLKFLLHCHTLAKLIHLLFTLTDDSLHLIKRFS